MGGDQHVVKTKTYKKQTQLNTQNRTKIDTTTAIRPVYLSTRQASSGSVQPFDSGRCRR